MVGVKEGKRDPLGGFYRARYREIIMPSWHLFSRAPARSARGRSEALIYRHLFFFSK